MNKTTSHLVYLVLCGVKKLFLGMGFHVEATHASMDQCDVVGRDQTEGPVLGSPLRYNPLQTVTVGSVTDSRMFRSAPASHVPHTALPMDVVCPKFI